MILSTPTRQEIERTFGSPLRYPSDFEGLSMEIMRKAGQPVSVNTLKRLFGIIGPEVEPRTSTLDILARYLNARNWDDYQARLSAAGNSDFEQDPHNIDTASLAAGTKVTFRYHPNRKVLMEHLGGGVFHVMESANSKLKPGDTLTVKSLCPGYPLTADKVLRDGVDMGAFVAGKVSGLSEIRIK